MIYTFNETKSTITITEKDKTYTVELSSSNWYKSQNECFLTDSGYEMLEQVLKKVGLLKCINTTIDCPF